MIHCAVKKIFAKNIKLCYKQGTKQPNKTTMLALFTQLADLLTFTLFGLDPDSAKGHAIHFLIEDTTKIFFLLITMVFIMSFLRSWLAPDKIRALMGRRSRMLAYGLAVLLGAITPFCSCSSIPLFIAFIGAGLPLGVTMAFLITSPMVNEVAAIMFGEAIGWPFTAAYVGAGMATGLIGGWLIDLLKLEKWLEPLSNTAFTPEQNKEKTRKFRARLHYAWQETADIIGRTWHYIIIGVTIGALIHGYVPQDWFVAHANADNLLAVPLAVLMAIPLYASVTGTVPIAEALIDKGLPVGTTLAFIMSTVALSLPELMILRRVLKPQMLIFFVVYMALAFILTGYGFNALFGRLEG